MSGILAHFSLSAGIDDALANHIAHLFIRDPLVIFNSTLQAIDELGGGGLNLMVCQFVD
jgi:hypothetical protein